MSQDIRHFHDIHGSDVYAPSRILLSRRPTVGTQDIQPSFDCLIVVLHSIYQHCIVGTDSPPDWLAKAEEKNPILGYAWLMFSHGAREDSLAWRRKVFKAVFSFGPSFENFCTSSLMNETFWSQDEFRLSRNFHSIETGDIVEGSADDIARASILEFDHAMNPSLTLDKVVEKSFGVISFKGQDVASIPSNPWIVRLQYKPALNASERLDINGLKLLYLPVWEQLMSQTNEGYREVGKAPYFLMAVVRLRDGDHQEEFVRTYNSYGANILADDDPEHPVNNTWSVKDSPGSYMLFYGLKTFVDLEDPMQFPEVGTPMIPPERAWVSDLV
ncbi:hypothetical protein NW768_011577 [Fusarium equiseti]|uniref:Uncharacterized protein n=1 Tax=Fusarium equiseti TaxID=61235 RepID=A0ABQ8QXM8_FUSEQ|nr:hypothetical protein NW768_011577 [Fusarium equiseti]